MISLQRRKKKLNFVSPKPDKEEIELRQRIS
jgi:hypothetical protein